LIVDCGLTRMFCANGRYGQGTRDMAGPEGLTTEKFIDKVRVVLNASSVRYVCVFVLAS
jgi:hypothetical protein